MSEAAIIGAVVLFILYLLIVTIFLKIALNIIGAKKTDFGEVFLTALICAIIAAIFTFLGASPFGILFVIIGVPWGAVLVYSVIIAEPYFDSAIGYLVYAISVFALAVILLSIHGQVLRRERRLKKELGIFPQPIRRQRSKHNVK